MGIPVGTTSGSGSYNPLKASVKKKRKKAIKAAGGVPSGPNGFSTIDSVVQPPAEPKIPDSSKYYDLDTAEGRALAVLDNPAAAQTPGGSGSPFIEGGPEPSGYFQEVAEKTGHPYQTTSYEGLQRERQIEDLRWAYRKLHGIDPTPTMMTKLLITLPVVTKVSGDVDDSATRRKLYLGLLAPTKGVGIDPNRLSGFSPEVYDPKMNGDGMNMAFAPARGDRSWGTTATPQGDVSALAHFRSPKYNREVRDKDSTPGQQLVHDQMTGDTLFLLQTLAEREVAAHKDDPEWDGVDFDPNSDEWDANKDLAYRRYIFNSQVKYIAGPDSTVTSAQRDKALKVITGIDPQTGEQVGPSLITDIYGKQDKEMLAVLKDARSTFKQLGMTEPVKDYLYSASMQGRPLGQSEIKARWDYANLMGPENCPAQAQAQMDKERMTFMRVMALPFEGAEKVIKAVHDSLPAGHSEVRETKTGGRTGKKTIRTGYGIGDVMDSIVTIDEGINGAMGYFGTAVGWVEARPVGTLLNIIGTALGTHIVDENGKLIHNPALLKGEKFDLDPGALVAASSWVTAFNATQGTEGAVLGSMMDDVFLNLGKDRSELSGFFPGLLAAIVAGGDLWATIKIGTVADKGVRYVVPKAAEAARMKGRKVYDSIAKAREARAANEAAGIKYANSFGFHIPKDQLAKLTPEARARVERYQAEHAEIVDRMDIGEDYAPAAGGDPDAPTTPAGLIDYIKDKGGIQGPRPEFVAGKGDVPAARASESYWDHGISAKENHGSFAGLLDTPLDNRLASERWKRKGKTEGTAMDELADMISKDAPGFGITDATSLMEWLQSHTDEIVKADKPKGGMTPEQLDAAAKAIEDKIDAELAGKVTIEADTPIVSQMERVESGSLQRRATEAEVVEGKKYAQDRLAEAERKQQGTDQLYRDAQAYDKSQGWEIRQHPGPSPELVAARRVVAMWDSPDGVWINVRKATAEDVARVGSNATKVEVDTPIVENPSTGQMGMLEQGRQTDLGLDEFAGEIPPVEAPVRPVEPMPGQTGIGVPTEPWDLTPWASRVVEAEGGKALPELPKDSADVPRSSPEVRSAFDQEHGLKVDNPYGGDAPARSITGYYDGQFMLDPRKLQVIKGERGERLSTWEMQPEVRRRMKNIDKMFEDAGGWPDELGPITVLVKKDGIPVIFEGNKRLLTAARRNHSEVPVEWKYEGGSEAVPGVRHPADFLPERQTQPAPTEPAKAGVEPPTTVNEAGVKVSTNPDGSVTVTGYHGTRGEMGKGKDFGGVHIGSRKAAEQRLADTEVSSRGGGVPGPDTSKVLPVEVTLKKPAGSVDNPVSETDLFTMNGAPKGKITALGGRSMNDLIAEGYDGIIYRNIKEDPGSISVQVFDRTAPKVTMNEAGVRVSEVKTAARAEEAESFYTDVAGDMRGSGDVIDAPLKTFHPADIETPMPKIPGEQETQLRTAYAMDEAMRRTLKENGIDVVPGAERGLIEDAFTGLPPAARSTRLFEHLADVLDERKLWDGQRGLVEVDASTARTNQRFNDNGWKTNGSHGLKSDHPKGHDTVKAGVEPYIEFVSSDLTTAQRRQLTAAANRLKLRIDRTGKKVVDGKDHSLISVHGDKAIDGTLADAIFGPETGPMGRPLVNGEPAPGTTPPGGGKAPPVEPLAAEGGHVSMPISRQYPWWLQNKAELIANYINEPHLASFVADLLGLTDDYQAKAGVAAAIDEMIASRDPQHVAWRIRELTNDVDPMSTGFAYHLKTRAEIAATKGNLPNLFRAMTTYVPYDVSVPMKDTHRHMMNFALITKMGKQHPTAADFLEARKLADEAWRTTDPNARLAAIHKLDDIVIQNMKDEPILSRKGGPVTSQWDRYVEFRNRLRTLAGKSAMDMGAGHRRAYGPGDKRAVRQSDYFALEAQIEQYSNRLGKMAENAGDRAKVQAALDAANKHLADMTRDGEIWNKYVQGKIPYEDAAAAGARLDNLVAPSPIYSFQVRKNLSHKQEINPRILATYQGGEGARAMAISAAFKYSPLGDSWMRAWKSMVMANLGFPIRVNVGDEFWRLIPEGLSPGSIRYMNARKMAKQLFGGKGLIDTALTGISGGHARETAFRALTRPERLELKSLMTDRKLNKVEKTRLAELEAKAHGTAERNISEVLFDKALADYAEYGSDDWTLSGPDTPTANYYVAMQDFLHQLSQEPFMKRWVEDGMPDLPRAELEARIRLQTQTTAEGVSVLISRGILDGDGKVVDKADFDNLISGYADTIEKVNSHGALRGAMESGRVSTRTLSKLGKDATTGENILWEIPVKTGIYERGQFGLASPFKTFYDHITLPLMSTLNGKLRETFFADRYLSESEKLLREHPEMSKQEIHENAAEKALEYTNTVTFSRNTTVFEDVNRNLVPFIASYRQFAVYWLKTFGRHPFAMSAAYQYNPLKDHPFAIIPGTDQSVPVGFVQPFMFQMNMGESDEGLKTTAKNFVPSGNPFVVSCIFAPIAAQLTKGDISKFPGLQGADPNLAPLSSPVGNAYYAITGDKLFGNTAILGRLTRPTYTQDKRHQDIQRSTARVVTPKNGASYVVHDYSLPYRLAAMLGVARPEALTSVVSKIGGLTATETPDYARMKTEGDIFMYTARTDAARAKYRAEHPWYDGLYTLTKENPTAKEIIRIVKRDSSYVYWMTPQTNATGMSDYATFQANLARGSVSYKEDDEVNKDIVNKWVDLMGGNKPNSKDPSGATTYYGGDVNRPAALKKFKSEIAQATSLAHQAAKDLSRGNPKLETQLFGLWKDSVETVDTTGNFVVAPQFADWARKHGHKVNDLNKGLITMVFQTDEGWGAKPRTTDKGPSYVDTNAFLTLAKSGLIDPTYVSKLISGSPAKDVLVKAAVDKDVYNRQVLYGSRGSAIGTKTDYSFTLTSNDLRNMGYNAGKGFDNAQAKVREFYYQQNDKGYDYCKKKYGYSSSEAREARNKYIAYRERSFKNVVGGEAIIGGLTKTMAIDKYFTELPGSFSGKNADKEQRLWQSYLAEARTLHPDMGKIREIKSHFDAKLKDRLEDRQRVSDWVATIAAASWLRYEMRKSYSDYYGGPGNSAATNYGVKKVKELERLIRSFYSDDSGEKRKGSLFGRDIELYFTDAHGLAYKMLDWTYH